ncbi:hypothetical protein M6B38_162855 [Iris pallida]|uniref:Uncharacterized protein n=1 Tax=Iris pallida TaxID=29817 RepID=A0AAX6F094_IRIPA|nr:hypothetical protein M6B38_162855 [Iris pallida]
MVPRRSKYFCISEDKEWDQRYKEPGFRYKITLTSGHFLVGNNVYLLNGTRAQNVSMCLNLLSFIGCIL